jgi:hypothetical protein
MTLQEFTNTFCLVVALSLFLGGVVIPYLHDRIEK